MSDKTRSRLGRRYPWILAGAIPFGIFFFLQWIVPRFSDNPSSQQWGLFWYYTLISIVFGWLYTVVNLPYTAMTPEMTQDYDERTSLNSFRFAFSIGGSILALILVGLISSRFAILSQRYIVIGIVCGVLSVLPLFWCVWGTFDHMKAVGLQHPEAEMPVSIPIAQQLKIALSNRPFLFVVGIYLCSWLSFQLTAAIIPYFVASIMRLNDAWSVDRNVNASSVESPESTHRETGGLLCWNGAVDYCSRGIVLFAARSDYSDVYLGGDVGIWRIGCLSDSMVDVAGCD
jgi:glycoside/pentoside/hexuronide:cation symporter, GPH family